MSQHLQPVARPREYSSIGCGEGSRSWRRALHGLVADARPHTTQPSDAASSRLRSMSSTY